jgi:hypothetical protein
MREIGRYKTQIAVGLPLPGGMLVVASSVWMPPGRAKGLITGAYMLLASLGQPACSVRLWQRSKASPAG